MTCRNILAALALLAAPALADDAGPAVVFDVGGIMDGGFNELVHEGAERFSLDSGVPYATSQGHDEAARDADLARFAEEVRSPILAVGYSQAASVAALAERHLEIDFAIIDAVVDLPNVQSIVFREHEGAYLAGLLAAMASRTGTVGFVGGMDIPVIRAFACGYRQGVAAAGSDIEVLEVMAGTTGDAWSDPLLGAELARQLVDGGADVVFQAAGGTGLGVLEAMADKGLLGIGVDADQKGLFPGHVLTSIVKRVDVATYATLTAGVDGSWQPGIVDLGIAEGGIDWALDEHNRALVSDAMEQAAETAKAEIVAGRLVVHDWRRDGACPL